jgi:AcrR family transcriptional regulator
MPKLWTDTITAHHEAVHGAVLDAAATLVAEYGMAGVTMSAIATTTGIGRATLYKYFPDVEAILAAWHERQIARHLAELGDIAVRPANPGTRLRAVLDAYLRNAFSHEHYGATMPGNTHVLHARAHMRDFLARIIAEAAEVGVVRADVPADELAAYALAALDAAQTSTKKAATGRLLELVLSGLAPPKAVRKSSRA